MNLKIVLGCALLILIGGGAFYYKNIKSNTKETYSETRIEKNSIRLEVQATGNVQPENRLEIKPPIPGRVETLLAREGVTVEKGQILAWMSSTERAALLDAARAQGAAEVKRWEELYKPTPIISPLSGTVISKGVEDGQTITSSDPIVVLSNRLTIKAQVDETDIGKIRLGQDADVILDAYSHIDIPAKVSLIAYEATTVNSVTTYLVDVTPLETPDVMRSGMTANVNFILDSKEEVDTINNNALIYRGNKVGVLVKDEKNQQSFKEIKIGITDGRISEIVSGLTEQDIILVKDVNFSSSGVQGGSNPFAPARPKSSANKQQRSR